MVAEKESCHRKSSISYYFEPLIILVKGLSVSKVEMCCVCVANASLSMWRNPGLLSMWVSSRRPFPYTSHQSKEIFDLKHWRPQQNCWRRHSPIYKHGLSDWDVLLKGWSRVEECGWTGWGERVCHQLVKQTLQAHITFRWLLLSSEMVQFISVVGVALGGRNFWLFTNQYRAPFKNNVPFWREWCGAGMVPLLCRRS